jgi:LysR family glycine cleavage system transcriptional activator
VAYSLPHLVWLRTFEASARHLSFAQAAQELGLTPAAVSQQIRALEAQVGFALFERLARGIRLTNMGRAYLPPVRRALDELSIATTGLFGTTAERVLTIRSSASFAALCLAPRLRTFRRLHPDIWIRVYASIVSEELDDSRFDVEIRYGDGRWDGYELQRLSAPVSVPVCPPASQPGPDLSEGLRRLVRHRPIHIIGCENLWAQLARDLAWPESDVAGGISVDTSVVALEMVVAGMGCAMISRDLAQHHHESGRVYVPGGVELCHDQSHFLLMPRRTHAPSIDALLFRDWLVDQLGEPGPLAPNDTC